MKNVIHIGNLNKDGLTEYMLNKTNKILVIPEEKDLQRVKMESFIFPIPVLVYNYIEKPNIDISDYNMLIIKTENAIALDILKKQKFEQVFCTKASADVENYLLENYKKTEDYFSYKEIK